MAAVSTFSSLLTMASLNKSSLSMSSIMPCMSCCLATSSMFMLVMSLPCSWSVCSSAMCYCLPSSSAAFWAVFCCCFFSAFWLNVWISAVNAYCTISSSVPFST